MPNAQTNPECDFVFVPLADLAKYANTLEVPPWEGDYPFDRATIQTCLDHNLLEPNPWDSGPKPVQTATDPSSYDRLYHARRVAWLVINRCEDPISIDVGVPSLGFQPPFLIYDGCHRLAAALFRGDPKIAIEFSGSVAEFNAMFPRRQKPKLKK